MKICLLMPPRFDLNRPSPGAVGLLLHQSEKSYLVILGMLGES